MQVVALIYIVTSVYHCFSQAKTIIDNDVISYPEEPEPDHPCKGLTYCTVKPKDYPEEKFNQMFKNYKVLPQPAPVPEISFENRLGDLNEIDNCESRVEYAPLYQVREKREDAWRTVIQVPQINFIQSIRMEICKNPDATCFTAYTPMAELVTFCKQKYITWQVLVAKGDNGTEVIKPQLPICCSCHYKSLPFAQSFGDQS